jgi:hypothetical protein
VIDAKTSLRDVAGSVASELRAMGHDPVVVGGSAATIHAPEAYRSDDIDMVVVGGIEDRAGFRAALERLGFSLRHGVFIHSESPYTVDFVPSPVAVGSTVINDFERVETIAGYVQVLKARDVVADRLNKYVVWRDEDSFQVAVSVARECGVSLSELQSFIDRQATGINREAFIYAFERLQRAVAPPRRDPSPFGFNSALRARFRGAPTHELADEVALQIRRLLDENRAEIDGLDSVDIRGDTALDGDHATIVLRLGTVEDLAFAEKLQLAIDSIAYVRAHVHRFDELTEVPDDGAPPIATLGS